jgi:protein involved in polysaccharide export with SLBB domain
MSRFSFSLFGTLLLSSPAAILASDPAPAPANAPAATDPSYHLSSGDTVTITVYNEPDLSSTQTIALTGEVRLPLIDEVKLAGKNVREAEHFLENTYKERQFLRTPVVTVVVVSYYPREVSVLGAVRAPGIVAFPRDVTSLDIVDVITRVGGFLPIAKSDAVTITHKTADGKETSTIVNLEDTISGRQKAGRDRANLAIYPGDRIWVPESLF